MHIFLSICIEIFRHALELKKVRRVATPIFCNVSSQKIIGVTKSFQYFGCPSKYWGSQYLIRVVRNGIVKS